MAEQLAIQDEGCLSDLIDPGEIAEIARQLPDSPTYSRMSELFKLLGDSTRLRILVALFQRDLCVHDLVALLSNPKSEAVSQSAVSHQLRLLRTAQVVQAERQGQRVRYSLIDNHIRELLESGLAHANE